MPISVTCPACKKGPAAPDALKGKKVRCPGCQGPVSGRRRHRSPAGGRGAEAAGRRHIEGQAARSARGEWRS